MNRANQLLLGVYFFAAIACGHANTGTPSVEKNNSSDKSCQYSLTDGDSIAASVSGPSVVKTAAFNKRYKGNWLDAVRSASGKATVDFVQSSGVNIYASDLTLGGNCLPYAGLPLPKGEIASQWSGNSGTISADGKWRLAGLYLAKGEQDYVQLKDKAAIIITQDANRWTLVHEFTHHNFAVQALEDGAPSSDVMKKQIKDSIDQIKAMATIETAAEFSRLADLVDQFSQAVLGIATSYSLEEMTIESTLQDAYAAGALKFVPDRRYNSASYITSSYTKAEEFLSSVKAINNASIDELYKSKSLTWSQSQPLSQRFEANIQKARDLLDEASRLEARTGTSGTNYSSSLLSPGLTVNFFGQDSSDGAYEGCSHSADVKEILDLIKTVRLK